MTKRDLTRRDAIALGAGTIAASTLVGLPARAQRTDLELFKIGVIFPSQSGNTRVATSINDYVGSAARQGSQVAEQVIIEEAAEAGLFPWVHQASSPSPSAAIRAAERLVEVDNVSALVGGVGDGQLEPLIGIAERAGIPLFNVGTSDDRFRREDCAEHVFHIEPSDAMYLDAMVAWSAAQGHRRWFIVTEDNARGHVRRDGAIRAIARHGQGGEAVGGAATVFEQPTYFNEINQAQAAGADAILIILDIVDQIAFFGQLDSSRIDAEPVPFADQTGQTRDFILALRELTRGYTPPFRFQSWDPTLQEYGAAEFGDTFLNRFASPAEPAGWASYSAVKILGDAAVATGSVNGADLISYLANETVEFDLLKGPGTSFRPWDNQLRQPLYAIEIDLEHEVQGALIGAALESQLAVANVIATLPEGGDLDALGDGPEDATCR